MAVQSSRRDHRGVSWLIEVAGVDRTTSVQPFSALSIENTAYEGSGTATIPIRVVGGAWTPANENSVRVVHDGVELFEGFVRGLVRGDEGYSTSPRIYTLKCQDFTSLLDDDVIQTAYRSTGETDKQRVTWLIQTWGTRGVTAGAEVQQLLAAMPGGTDGRPEQDFSGKTLRQALDQVAQIAGARFYVDYDKKLHWFATESSSAPFALSDTPNNTSTFGYGGLRIEDDSIDLVHEVLVVGTGISVFRAISGAPAAPNRRRAVLKDENITSSAQAQASGDAYLARYGTPVRSGSLTTWKAGLRAGMTVQITNQGHGLSGTAFRVNSVVARPQGAKVEFRIEFGDQRPNLASVIGGVKTIVEDVRDSVTPTIERTVFGLQAGGANLIPNSDFEKGTGGDWVVGARWVLGSASVNTVSGTHISTAHVTGTDAAALTLANRIGVDRTMDYWFSWHSLVAGRTAGNARVVMKEYSSGGSLLRTTTLLDVSATESDWTRHSVHYGPNDQIGRTGFHASTASVNFEFLTTGSATLDFNIDAIQFEQSAMLTAYAPAPYELMDGQIVGPEIASAAISTTKIADNAITTPKVLAGAIDTNKLAANAVTAGKIAAGAVTAGTIAANAVTATEIAADAITTAKIAAGAVTATEIASSAITTAKFNVNARAPGVNNTTGEVLIDPAGITVTNGAITVRNSGSVVIIDGSSNMFKIVSSVTFSEAEWAAPGERWTGITVGGGLGVRPSFLAFLLQTNPRGDGVARAEQEGQTFSLTSGGGGVLSVTGRRTIYSSVLTSTSSQIMVYSRFSSTGTVPAAQHRVHVLKEAAI